MDLYGYFGANKTDHIIYLHQNILMLPESLQWKKI